MPQLPQFLGGNPSPSSRPPRPSGGGGGGGGGPGPGSVTKRGKILIVETGDAVNNFMRFISTLGVLAKRLNTLGPVISTNTANIIANMYITYLQRGVGDSLAPLTRALINGNRPPLAALSRHVIVRPATVSRPAAVTFEKGWSKKAQLLHTGFYMDMTGQAGNRVRRGLIRGAMDNVGATKISQILDEHGSSQGIWTVPARPHINFLKRPEIQRIVEHVYEWEVYRKPLPAGVAAAARLRPPGIKKTPFIMRQPTTNTLDGVVL